VVAGLVVLALLTVFAIELSDTQNRSRQDVIARVHERSVLAASLINALLHSVDKRADVYSARFGARRLNSQTLNLVRGQNLYVAVLGPAGRVLSYSRGFNGQAGADLFRAELAMVKAGRPYGLGDLLPYGRTGVINLAVAFASQYGRRYLVTGVDPRSLAGFLDAELRRIPGVTGSRNYVLDSNNTVLASNNPAQPTGYRITSRAEVSALSHSSGDRAGYYYDQTPITNSTWRLILSSPNGPLFASVSGFSKSLPWIIFSAFALVAGAALVLGSRILRSAETELRQANARLETVNDELAVANTKLAHDALHDPLTGLPNRALLMDRLHHLVQRAERESYLSCAVLFIDLDNFKLVNDRLGHAVGDDVLAAVAARFVEAVRPGDTVARIGGDEFAVLLDAIQTEREAVTVAQRIHASLDAPIELEGNQLSIVASVGIALPSPGLDGSDLLSHADAAMYEAKRRGASHAIFGATTSRRRSGAAAPAQG
jgi:diguanylate cyclase (GGDEF)-like protein